MANFRILSLDGGGTWALIQVKALMKLFGSDAQGHDVLHAFDFAAANSGGTIVLGGLIANFRLSEILNLFKSETDRRRIFVERPPLKRPIWDILRHWEFGPRYLADRKLDGLRALMGDPGDWHVSTLPDRIGPSYSGRRIQFVFCGFDYDRSRAAFFRSDMQSRSASFGRRADLTVAQAIHASSNAPVNYFDRPARVGDRRYWDGAIGGYNNPVLCGAIEVVANAARYDASPGEIRVLSIGTGSIALPVATGEPGEDPRLVRRRLEPGLLEDVKKLATSILDDPPDAASFHAYLLLGCRLPAAPDAPVADERIVRMNPLVRPLRGTGGNPWIPPLGLSADDVQALDKLPMDAVAQDQVELIERMCNAWLADHVPNQALRANGTTFAPEIGHASFTEAEAAWRTLTAH